MHATVIAASDRRDARNVYRDCSLCHRLGAPHICSGVSFSPKTGGRPALLLWLVVVLVLVLLVLRDSSKYRLSISSPWHGGGRTREQLRKHRFFSVLLCLSCFVLGVLLEFHNGRISNNTFQIWLEAAKILPLWIFFVSTPAHFLASVDPREIYIQKLTIESHRARHFLKMQTFFIVVSKQSVLPTCLTFGDAQWIGVRKP